MLKLHIVLVKQTDWNGKEAEYLYVVNGAESDKEAISMIDYNLQEQGNALQSSRVFSLTIPPTCDRATWKVSEL